MSAAAFSFHGGMFVFAWASWSVIFGFHTPLQSGSLARSAQSCAVGGGLMTGFSGSAAPQKLLNKISPVMKSEGLIALPQRSCVDGETGPAPETDDADPDHERRRAREAGPAAFR